MKNKKTTKNRYLVPGLIFAFFAVIVLPFIYIVNISSEDRSIVTGTLISAGCWDLVGSKKREDYPTMTGTLKKYNESNKTKKITQDTIKALVTDKTYPPIPYLSFWLDGEEYIECINRKKDKWIDRFDSLKTISPEEKTARYLYWFSEDIEEYENFAKRLK